jgi:hypothetical protein
MTSPDQRPRGVHQCRVGDDGAAARRVDVRLHEHTAPLSRIAFASHPFLAIALSPASTASAFEAITWTAPS